MSYGEKHADIKIYNISYIYINFQFSLTDKLVDDKMYIPYNYITLY